jgi:hypothetical protein
VEDYLPAELIKILNGMSIKGINSLYLGAHFLKITKLRQSIAAYIACKVHISKDKANYNSLKSKFGVEKEITP